MVAEGKHGWHKPLREAAVQWCRRWLLNDNSPITEPEDIGFFEDEKELRVTKTGQVLTSFPDELSVSDLTRKRLVNCKINRVNFLRRNNLTDIISKIKKITGYEDLSHSPKYKLISSFIEDNYKVDKYLIERDPDYKFYLPALLFTPDKRQENSTTVIIVSEFGKYDELPNSFRLKDEINTGNIVLSLDISNTGELKDYKEKHYDNKEFWIAKMALYEGKSLMTYRIEDIILAKRFLQKNILNGEDNFKLISIGLTGPAALHAAVIDGTFKDVTLINYIHSWENVASSDYIANQIANIIPAVLNYYDLPDLINLIPQTRIQTIY